MEELGCFIFIIVSSLKFPPGTPGDPALNSMVTISWV